MKLILSSFVSQSLTVNQRSRQKAHPTFIIHTSVASFVEYSPNFIGSVCAEPPINELLLIDEQIVRRVVCIYFAADMMTNPSASAVGERNRRNAVIDAAVCRPAQAM